MQQEYGRTAWNVCRRGGWGQSMKGGKDVVMKRTLLAVAVTGLLLIVAPASLAAGISVSPIELPTIEVEMPRSDWGPWASFNVFGMSGRPRLGADFDVTVTALGAGTRYYLDGAANGGVYLGGYGGVYWLSGEYKGEDTLARALILSAASGYKWILDDFFFDIGARVSFPVSASESNDLYNAHGAFHDAFGTQLHLGVGLTF